MQKYKKHHRLSPNSMINSFQFFLFLVIFIQLLFFSVFLSPVLLLLWMPFHVIYHDLCSILTVHVWFRCWELQAACLLFRHHFHINAARELVGKHLMWRKQLLQIFVILHPHLLPSIYPSLCHKIPLIYYIKGMGMFLATSDRSSEVNILLGYG